jgi:hypothetical protein
MTNNGKPTNVIVMRIYSLGAQRRALQTFFEVTVTHWSLNAQDALALIGLDVRGDLESLTSNLLPPDIQLALYEFTRIAKAYGFMPHIQHFNGGWLCEPTPAFNNSAPIDLMLSEGRIGIRKVAAFLTDEATKYSLASIDDEFEW